MIDHNFMKRMAPFLVLEILKNHTDGEHGLQVTQIVELLQQDYGVTAERKAVSRILNDLFELTELPTQYSWKYPMPYTIKFDTTHRRTGDIRDNWRLYKQFEDVEVRLLMDAVQSVQGYPTDRVLGKLRQLGGITMQKNFAVSCSASGERKVSSKMPYSMDEIERAIRAERKVTFDYIDTDVPHVVSPYRMMLRNGVYYLIGYDDGKEAMAHFRVADMSNTAVLDAPAKDYHTVKAMSRWQYDLGQYLDHHIAK